MQQNPLPNFLTKPERENSNDGLQTGSVNATKNESSLAGNQDGGLQTGIEITYMFTLHVCNEIQMVINVFIYSFIGLHKFSIKVGQQQ